jgi:uncharacterized delta-60 repeat protein
MAPMAHGTYGGDQGMRKRKLRGTVLFSTAAVALVGAAVALGAFGTGGKVIVNVGGTNSADGVALGKGGTVVGAGTAVPGATGFDFAVVRLTSAGVPDPGFSGDGEQTTDAGGFDTLNAVAVQKDGAIVAGGSTDAVDDQRRAAMIRYEADGDPDPSFSQDGIQVFPFGEKASRIDDIALLENGKIVVAGSIEAAQDGQDALVARVKPNGKLDKRFGKKGVRKFGVKDGTSVRDLAIQKDDRIVVTGDTGGTEMGDNSSQLYARLTKNGKLDKSFSGDGIFTRKVKGASTRVEDVAVDDKSGRIVGAVGIFGGPDPVYGVATVMVAGTMDMSFGKKGTALRDFGVDTLISSIAVQRAGGIVVGGAVRVGDYEFLLARFTKKGKLDETFGFKGATTTDFVGTGDLIQALAVGKQDVIVAAGIGDGDFGFARYLENGAIDD